MEFYSGGGEYAFQLGVSAAPLPFLKTTAAYFLYPPLHIDGGVKVSDRELAYLVKLIADGEVETLKRELLRIENEFASTISGEVGPPEEEEEEVEPLKLPPPVYSCRQETVNNWRIPLKLLRPSDRGRSSFILTVEIPENAGRRAVFELLERAGILEGHPIVELLREDSLSVEPLKWAYNFLVLHALPFNPVLLGTHAGLKTFALIPANFEKRTSFEDNRREALKRFEESLAVNLERIKQVDPSIDPEAYKEEAAERFKRLLDLFREALLYNGRFVREELIKRLGTFKGYSDETGRVSLYRFTVSRSNLSTLTVKGVLNIPEEFTYLSFFGGNLDRVSKALKGVRLDGLSLESFSRLYAELEGREIARYYLALSLALYLVDRLKGRLPLFQLDRREKGEKWSREKEAAVELSLLVKRILATAGLKTQGIIEKNIKEGNYYSANLLKSSAKFDKTGRIVITPRKPIALPFSPLTGHLIRELQSNRIGSTGHKLLEAYGYTFTQGKKGEIELTITYLGRRIFLAGGEVEEAGDWPEEAINPVLLTDRVSVRAGQLLKELEQTFKLCAGSSAVLKCVTDLPLIHTRALLKETDSPLTKAYIMFKEKEGGFAALVSNLFQEEESEVALRDYWAIFPPMTFAQKSKAKKSSDLTPISSHGDLYLAFPAGRLWHDNGVLLKYLTLGYRIFQADNLQTPAKEKLTFPNRSTKQRLFKRLGKEYSLNDSVAVIEGAARLMASLGGKK